MVVCLALPFLSGTSNPLFFSGISLFHSIIGISFFKCLPMKLQASISLLAGATVVTYVQAKIASHDEYCTTTTFAPVTAHDTGHVNDYKPIKLSKLLESHSKICVYGRLFT